MEPGVLASPSRPLAAPLEPATLARWEHAMRSADTLALLKKGRIVAQGAVREMATAEQLAALYEVDPAAVSASLPLLHAGNRLEESMA